ncbi:MAG: porin [Verrucomicrobiia bacterium]
MQRLIINSRLINRFISGKVILLASICVFGIFGASGAEAKEEAKKEDAKSSEEEKEYNNWVEFGFGGASVNGNEANFQRRMGVRQGVFGGISDFHFEQSVGKEGLFTIDGRGIFDNHDYKLKLGIEIPDKFYIRGGYSQSRYWYDGSGGFHPALPWYDIYDDRLHLDRQNVWVEAGLRFPDLPQITFRYERYTREGLKDSTSWGSSMPGLYGIRNIVPSFLGIDETRDVFLLDVSKKIKSTELGLGFRYDTQDIDNKRYERIFPGGGAALDRYITQKDYVSSDLFNIHAYSKTWLKEKTLFTMGYSFTDMDTDTAGYRRYGNYYDPDFANRLPHFESFENMVGGSLLKQHVASVNLMQIIKDNLTISPSVRIESQDIDSSAFFLKPSLGGGAPWNNVDAYSQRNVIDVSERLELRYTGVTNWVFYARGDWLQGSGDLTERLTGDPLPLLNNVDRSTDDERYMQKYTVGFNWYPINRLSISSEYYHKIRINKYDNNGFIPSSPINLYPNYFSRQEFETDDVNLRLTWRPLNNLTLVGRYDFQLSTIQNRSWYDSLGDLETAEVTSHILSGSVTWSPFNRLYLQGSVSYAMDKTDTLADTLTGAAYGLVLDARNNYWNTSVTAGYALCEKADFETTYGYYRADNAQNNAIWGLPLGSNAKEHSVTAGIVYRVSKRVRWNLKYGFYDYNDALTGSNNDYTAHTVFSTIQMRF